MMSVYTGFIRFIFVLPLLIISGCQEDPDGYPPPQSKDFTIPVMRVQVEEIPRLYRVPGSIKSDERIQISSRITGYLQKISVYAGDRTTKGAVLVEIEPTEVEGAISRAKAALDSAKTALRDTERDVSRLSRLLAKGITSNEKYRKAKVIRDVARSTLADSKAALDTAMAGRKYASIISPINGIVVSRHKQVGDLATPGVPVLTIESRTKLLFKTAVAERRISHVRTGDKVRVVIDALGDMDMQGVVLRVIPSGDPVTRRYDVEITLPAKIEAFPGMFGRAYFSIGSDKLPVVPIKALVKRGGLKGVFVLDREHKVGFRWLRTGRRWKNAVVVLAGLDGGETILAQGDRRIHDGDLIKPEVKVATDG